MNATYFHGGFPGLKPGNMVLPPTITKASCCSDYGAAGVHRRDRVYLCTEPDGALIYAALHPSGRGIVYQVEPVGAIEPDPDWSGPAGVSVQVESAQVIRVLRVPDRVLAMARQQLIARTA